MAKDESDVMSEGWGIMPNKVLHDGKLSEFEKLLYCELSSLCARRGFCWASNGYLAEGLKVSPRKVTRGLRRLVDKGYIGIENGKSLNRRIRVGQPRHRWRGNLDTGVQVNIDTRVQQNSISINSIKNNALRLRRRTHSKKAMDDDYEVITNIDPESGEEITHDKFGRPLKSGPKVKREGKNKIAVRIQLKFQEKCKKEVGVVPVMNFIGYKMALRAINSLTEEQVYDLFDEWFSLGKPDEEAVQITRALSDNNVNAYKARNGVE